MTTQGVLSFYCQAPRGAGAKDCALGSPLRLETALTDDSDSQGRVNFQDASPYPYLGCSIPRGLLLNPNLLGSSVKRI